MTDPHGQSTIRILHVDDDPEFAALTAEFLTHEDDRFEVLTETSATAVLDRLRDEGEEIDCVVSDYQMPGMDGLELLQAIRTQLPDQWLPFLLLTGRGSEEIAADALNAGASSYVRKGGPDTYEYVATRIHEDLQRARAEQNSARFFTLADALDDPVYVLDNEGQFTDVNDALTALAGYGRGELLGSDPSVIKDEKARAAAEQHLARILSDDGPDSVTFEVEIQPKSGDPIPCEDHMGVLPYEGTDFQGSVGVLRDISERKARERALTEAKEHYRILVEQNLIGLYITRGTELIYHNERFAELFGYPAESNVLAGESFLPLVEAADRGRLEENLTGVEADYGESLREPYIGVCHGGETVNVELHARGIDLDDEPAVIGTVVGVNDDDRLWELRRERDRLEEFTSIVSHDLRSPLSVARGQVELARTGDDAASGDVLSTVADALDRMDELVAELLTLAKQGEVVSDREAVDLPAVAESTWRNVATAGTTLEVTADGEIDADPGRIKAVFENLYRNSIDHTDGDVTVTVGDLDADGGARGFYVADDGAGIPADERTAVFETGYTTADDGTGFGLAIVAEIVEAHGWQIKVCEGRDGGARFEIRDGEYPIRPRS